jgi:hypothetical protein
MKRQEKERKECTFVISYFLQFGYGSKSQIAMILLEATVFWTIMQFMDLTLGLFISEF